MIHRLKHLLILAAAATLASCAVAGPQSLTPDIMPCPPDMGDRRLERDLTRSFATRLYLLDSGAVCKPVAPDSMALSVASHSLVSTPAGGDIKGGGQSAYLKRFRGGQH